MSEPKFTQGLWNNCDGETIETKKARICIIAPLNLTQEESDANAALIAAAPEMYEALVKLKECLEGYFGKTEKDFFKDCNEDSGELYFAAEYNAAVNALKNARGKV